MPINKASLTSKPFGWESFFTKNQQSSNEGRMSWTCANKIAFTAFELCYYSNDANGMQAYLFS